MRTLLVWLLLAAGALAEVRVQVRHTFRGEPLRLGEGRYQNAAGERFSITRLSYLLSGVAVQREDGAWQELPGAYAWMDAGSERTAFTLPVEGAYRALRFSVGVGAEENSAPAERFAADHPLNPNVNGLHWSWQGGYVGLAVEGLLGDAASGFVFHLAGEAARREVVLPCAGAAPVLEFDLARLLDWVSLARDGTATHSRPGDVLVGRLGAALPGAWQVLPTEAAPAAVHTMALPELPATYTPYRLRLPRGFPIPDLPRDNPLIQERVELGRQLFHEPALSRDRTVSCATCHQAEHAFAEPARVSHGVEGRAGERNAMPLFNLAWKRQFFWDGRAGSLRAAVWEPIRAHQEMDLPREEALRRLREKPEYQRAFAAAFAAGAITAEYVGLALEQFLLTLVSGASKFDRAMRNEAALTPEEQRGFSLFMTEYDPRTGQRGADCFHCHGGPLFTDHQLHNNGLVGAGGHKFATPSLRNLTRTGPYMHDGRFATLEAVVAHYCGPMERNAALDPNLAKHPPGGLRLTAEEQAALVAFLRALSN